MKTKLVLVFLCIHLTSCGMAGKTSELQGGDDNLRTNESTLSSSAGEVSKVTTAKKPVVSNYKLFATANVNAKLTESEGSIHGEIAFDSKKIYLFTKTIEPSGLSMIWEAPISSAGPSSSLQMFPIEGLSKGLPAENKIASIKSLNNELYVLKLFGDASLNKKKLVSKLLVSRDFGKTFSQVNTKSLYKKTSSPFGDFIDESFYEDFDIVEINGRKAMVLGGTGRNATVSYDNGKNWNYLVPTKEPLISSAGYATFFTFSDGYFYTGGEFPLDEAFLARGKIEPDSTVKSVHDVTSPELSNQRIQFISASKHDSKLMFAGQEGALLRSIDGGATWTHTYFSKDGTYDLPGRHGPYVNRLVYSTKDSNFVTFSGSPNTGMGQVRASCDRGSTWTDLSETILPSHKAVDLKIIPQPDGTDKYYVVTQHFTASSNPTEENKVGPNAEIWEFDLKCE